MIQTSYMEILSTVGASIPLSTWTEMKAQGDPFKVPEDLDSRSLQNTLDEFKGMLTASHIDIDKIRPKLLRELETKVNSMSGVTVKQNQIDEETTLRGVPWNFEGALFFRNISNSNAVLAWTDFSGLQRFEEGQKPKNLKISFTREEKKKYGVIDPQKLRTAEISLDGKEMYFIYEDVPHIFRASLVSKTDKPLSVLRPESIRKFNVSRNHYLVRSSASGRLLYQNGEAGITVLIDPGSSPETDIRKPIFHHEFINFSPNGNEIIAVKGTQIFKYDMNLEPISEPVSMRNSYHSHMLPLEPTRIFQKLQVTTQLHPDGKHLVFVDSQQKAIDSLRCMNMQTGYSTRAAVPSKFLMQVHSQIHRTVSRVTFTPDGRYTVILWEDSPTNPSARKLVRNALLTLYDLKENKAYNLNLSTAETGGMNIDSTSSKIMVAYPETKRVEIISIEELKETADEKSDLAGL